MFLIELRIIINQQAMAHCSTNDVNRFKTADADEKLTDVKKEADNALPARRIQWRVLNDSETALITTWRRTISRWVSGSPGSLLGQELCACVKLTFILRKWHSFTFPNERTTKARLDFLGFLAWKCYAF